MSDRAVAVALWIVQTLVIAVAATMFGALFLGIGLAAGGMWLGVTLRTIAALSVVATVLARVRRHRRSTSMGFHLSSSTAAYLLMPLTWTGHALMAGATLQPTPLAVVVDLLLWLAVSAAIIRLQSHRHPATEADGHHTTREWAR